MNQHLAWLTANTHNPNSSLTIQRIWLELTNGDFNLSALIGQVVFWSHGQSSLGFGKFYKTDAALGAEIYMNRLRVLRLKNKLCNHPILGPYFSCETHKINGTPQAHWSVDLDGLAKCAFLKMNQIEKVQNIETAPLQAPSDMDCSEVNNGLFESEQSDCSKVNNLSITDPNNRSKQDLNNCAFNFEDEFKAFWKGYPTKVNKAKAKGILRRIFKDKKRMGDRTPTEFMQHITDHVKASIEAQVFGFDKLHLTTYLNGDRWQDEIQADLYKPKDKLKDDLQSYLAKHTSIAQDVTPTPHAALELDPLTGRWSTHNGHRVNG